MSEPVYRRIETVSGEDALLAKLEEAEGDWLGVHNGQWLFGFPGRGGVMEIGSVDKHIRAGAAEGRHEVRILRGSADGSEAFATEEEAREAYEDAVSSARSRRDAAVVRLQRIEGGQVVDDQTVIRPLLRIEEAFDSLSLTLLGVILSVVLAVGFGLAAALGWLAGLVAATLSAILAVGAIRWAPSKGVILRACRWMLRS